ncbi:Bifunctional protein FolD protein [uncultured archaeon]|nr:Bifunctional protein FolD protein [uncultured archaeon]
MAAKIIDGRKIAGELNASLKEEVARLRQRGIVPKLVVVQVGRDPSSTIYVEKKHKTCLDLGIESEIKRFGENVPYAQFIAEITALNNDPKVHGILVQSPLPLQLAKEKVYEIIAIEKDVDGWHPHSHGMNLLNKQGLRPATPKGVMKLLESTGVRLEGKNAVVIGRSNIVGKPVALMLINSGCTVTVCNSRTKNSRTSRKRPTFWFQR